MCWSATFPSRRRNRSNLRRAAPTAVLAMRAEVETAAVRVRRAAMKAVPAAGIGADRKDSRRVASVNGATIVRAAAGRVADQGPRKAARGAPVRVATSLRGLRRRHRMNRIRIIPAKPRHQTPRRAKVDETARAFG